MEKIDLQKLMKDLMRSKIKEAMKASGGHKTKAAELLSIKRPILHYHIKKLGLVEQDWTQPDAPTA